MAEGGPGRPGSVAGLAVFFGSAAVVSVVAAAAVAFPGGALEPMWRLNPRAREGFAAMGPWAVALLVAVGLACTLAARGLWTGSPWGRRLAFGILAVNLVGDAANALILGDLRSAVGVPVVLLLSLPLLSKRGREFFRNPS